MKFSYPSTSVIRQELKALFLRFPIQIICALLINVLVLYTRKHWDIDTALFFNIIFAIALIFLTTLAADLFCEEFSINQVKKWLARVVSIALSAGIISYTSPYENSSDTLSIILFSLTFFIALSFIGIIKHFSIERFTIYNTLIIARLSLSLFYSIILYLGLTGALMAVESLFSLNISSTPYLYIQSIIFITFNTLFFLAGVPHSQSNWEGKIVIQTSAMKMLISYILIPLASIYCLILSSYTIKIAIEQTLPKGLVSGLILGYAALGLVTVAFIQMFVKYEKNKTVQLFTPLFFGSMLLLLPLLYLSIYERLKQYSLTEQRYILVLIGLWLLFVSLYFLLKRNASVKYLPISLAFLCLFASFGPQSARNVAMHAQIQRLATIKSIKEKASESRDLVWYIYRHYGIKAFQSLTTINLAELQNKTDTNSSIKSISEYNVIDSLCQILNIQADGNTGAGISRMLSYFRPSPKIISTMKADYMIDFQIDGHTKNIEAENMQLILNRDILSFSIANETQEFDMGSICQIAAENLEKYKRAELPHITSQLNFSSHIAILVIEELQYDSIAKEFKNLKGRILIKEK